MIELSANFPTNKIKEICQCGEEEMMEHIYNCEYLSEKFENEKPSFEKIFGVNIFEQRNINRIFSEKYQRRKKRNQTSVISCKDPQ